jgi:arabinose-5-phosphate isomerase
VPVPEQLNIASPQPTLLQAAREVLATEAAALATVRARLGESFSRAATLIFEASTHGGSIIVTGMGKAGIVGQKIAATLASTGTPAHSMHPAEAVHGDLGRITARDVVLAISYSGETEEVIRLISSIRRIGAKLIALTSIRSSRLARAANVAIELGPIEEACPMKLAPSASTTAMMALGDALAFAVSRMRNFQPEHFAEFHPAGNLGRLTAPVDEVMRMGEQLRIAHFQCTVREALVDTHKMGRRTGALLLVDDLARLRGIFTDADLARLLESRRDAELDQPICMLMNTNPTTIASGKLVRDAIAILSSRKFSQLPVVDAKGCPIGILDITDLIGLLPQTQVTGSDTTAETLGDPIPAGSQRTAA